MTVSTTPRALCIATAGGHLTQLNALAPRLGIDPETALWVTIATPQSKSLLRGRDVVWADYSHPRDIRGLGRHLRLARQVTGRGPFTHAVSTGASLAAPFLAAARIRGIPCHYVESATRVDGPSFSGKLVARIPGAHLYTQYRSWSTARWHYRGSIFDGWVVEVESVPRPIKRAVVTVGSARGFPFDRMLVAARDALPRDCEVLWQVLDAQVSDLPGRVVEELDSASLRAELTAADLIISHAGTGSALTALELGRCPVLIPRRAAHHEHVDDHQLEIARMLSERGLAVVREADRLTSEDLVAAASRTARATPGPAFELDP